MLTQWIDDKIQSARLQVYLQSMSISVVQMTTFNPQQKENELVCLSW